MKKQIKTIINKLSIIVWHDACSRSGWQDMNELKKWREEDKSYLCENIGWIVEEDNNFIVICARRSEYDNTYGLCEKLPKKMVEKIKLIKNKIT